MGAVKTVSVKSNGSKELKIWRSCGTSSIQRCNSACKQARGKTSKKRERDTERERERERFAGGKRRDPGFRQVGTRSPRCHRNVRALFLTLRGFKGVSRSRVA